MRLRTTLWVIPILLAAITLFGAQKSDPARVAMEAAKKKEVVDGDLNAAIQQYKTILDKFKNDRSVVADALVRMAGCYQKLGDAESKKLYDRVLNEYGDQKDAAEIARAHVAGQSGIASRRIWTDASGFDFSGANISPDGRLVSFADWGRGDVGVHDFTTDRDRYITNNHDDRNWVEASAISRNGKEIAYCWFNGEKKNYELRVASMERAGNFSSRILADNKDYWWVWPFDWSPDGNWIAVQFTLNGSFKLGLVSVRDGSIRVLKSSDWLGANRLFFSPDGKYLGFDLPAGTGEKAQRDVFIIAVDGSRQVTAADGPSNETMMGWSPDGRRLLFASDRGGTTALWALSVIDGKPQGTPELVKSDISRYSLGVSTSGILYESVWLSDHDIRVASVDFASGRLLGGPARPIQSFMGTNADPSWSADGKQLVYKSRRLGLGSAFVNNEILGILSLETGQVRELKPDLAYFSNPTLMADGQSALVYGKNLGSGGPFQVDLRTGKAMAITPAERQLALDPPMDGKRFYRKDLGADGIVIGERDIASGKEREIIREKGLTGFTASPNRQLVATIANNAAAKSSTLLLVSVATGERRELLRVSPPQSMKFVAWTADNASVLVTKSLDQKTELWRIPIANGQPQKIDIGTNQFSNLQVSPDGRHVAYESGDSKQEIWMLENFLPLAKANK